MVYQSEEQCEAFFKVIICLAFRANSFVEFTDPDSKSAHLADHAQPRVIGSGPDALLQIQ